MTDRVTSEKPAPAAEPATRRKVLVVDDDALNRRALRRTFADDFEVHEAADGKSALEISRRLQPDIVVSDQQMPRMTGVELLATIKEELPNAVRVLVTGYHDYGSVVGAVNAARVHHYLEKPFHTLDVKSIVEALLRANDLQVDRERLSASLAAANAELERRKGELEILVHRRTEQLSRTNTDLERANARLREMAVRDELTGLFNRRCLFEQLDLELERSKRYERPFSLLFLDVDDFKPINDELGHAAGDAVLKGLSEMLRSGGDGVRRSDFVARYGGEEFCVLLPETPIEGATVKAERLRAAVESMRVNVAERTTHVTISVGIATYPMHGDSIDAVVRAADDAQYVAKKSGKNRVAIADESQRS
jgi:diguanylate cyclase (GGDEF)-like protein